MDKSLFLHEVPGELREIIVEGTKDWSFIPAPLPNKLELPEKIWCLLVQAREELARLDGVGRHIEAYELLLRPLQQREALRSSSLEGTYATPQQLLLYEIDPREPKSTHDPVNAWKEVSNYGKALVLGQKLLENIPISLRLIKDIHKELLSGVRGHHRDPGNFRRSQVHIGADRRFIPPPHNEIINCLDNLEKYIHKDNIEIDPLIFCFMVHYQFEAIHPFLDGNGRVGRLLLSLMIYKFCGLSHPWLYLSAFFDKYKDEYINYLFQFSSKGNWQDWIAFCLRGTIAQSKDAIKRFDQLVYLHKKYDDAISQIGGNVRLHKIIDKLFESPVVTVTQLASTHNISYPTAKSDIQRLVNAQILHELESEYRPQAYFALEIVNVAYNDFIEEEKIFSSDDTFLSAT
ncbi:Fic family protein [Nostoc sp. DedSLP04]|uniref:Fic family protein n=1 Tax=Nostoc sp. DedSLP04 TaxID=3075401 RepID=UPI002AD3A400|nr:Fic/DOC family N-terminal domain-containing protein [Nostoc sp. DedSLP04]MDZ8031859.1 Fic family protein [Nostoc sp. DedSLP04]